MKSLRGKTKGLHKTASEAFRDIEEQRVIVEFFKHVKKECRKRSSSFACVGCPYDTLHSCLIGSAFVLNSTPNEINLQPLRKAISVWEKVRK